MAGSFTRRRLRMFVRVIVPSLYPFIFATLRIMFGVAWKVTLTAELFGGDSGLGYMINLSRQEFDTATISPPSSSSSPSCMAWTALCWLRCKRGCRATMPVERTAFPSVIVERLIGDGVVVLALVGWWALARHLPDFILPGPVAVARQLPALFVSADFLGNLLASTWRVLVSIAAALLIGGGLAFLGHGVPWMAAVVDKRIKPMLNAFPSIGWAILAAIWFEPGNLSVIFVEVMILIPFCLINIAEGLRNVDREVMEMGRSFTRHRARILWRLTLPLLVPYALSATRIAYGIAWKIALVAELLGAPSGLGYLMLRAQTAADSTTFLATCFVIVLIFALGERLVIVPLERRFERR